MSSNTKFINEPVIEFDEAGNCVPFIPVSITNGRQAYAASLNIIFKHIAEFHIVVLNIIAEKHGLNVNDILEEVHKDDRYIRMSRVIDNLGAFPVDTPTTVDVVVPVLDMPVSEIPAAAAKKLVIRKRKPKAEDEIVQAMTQLTLEMPEEYNEEKDNEEKYKEAKEQQQPKKRVYKKRA
jgi:hypothetical protein